MLTPDELKLLRDEFRKQLVGDERYSYPMSTPRFCIPEVEQRWQNYILENKIGLKNEYYTRRIN